jgi:hypothetical protein
MVPLMIVLGILLVLVIFGTFIHTTTRLSFLEKEADIISFTPVLDSEYPDGISGYKPVVRFEVNEKLYEGTADVFPLWLKQEGKSVTILYNPQNPAEFKVKEASSSPVTGCIFAVVVVVALAVTVYFYLNG